MAIVRHITVVNNSTGPTSAAVSTSFGVYVFAWIGIASADARALDLRQVLNAGESISADAGVGLCHFMISGYLLSTGG